ncbi:PAS domain-containing sensor histidine kinase [Roseomonas sp. AR75]|uniref:hybrid sensor histidine kinase/response regulator n=1 Tax=Roseomonas sp. AR75 TaxID=2562311 RepID=UPI0010C0AF75|nr:PAS domain-containing sensor histidine kinase [Roseomonas sp. AR75]
MADTVALGPDDRTYRLLVEAVVDYAIFLLDPEGRVASWNAGARRIKGYADQDVIGRHFSMFFTDEDCRAGLPQRALERARDEGRHESEGWRRRKDGSRFWALAVLDAVRDDSGRLLGFAKVTRDLSQRRATELALLESERQFRLLVQGVTDYAIFMLAPDGSVTSWNAGARRIKGYETGEILGQHFSRFYTEEDRRAAVPARALAQAATTGRFEAEGWRLRKDGTRFWASVIIDAIRDEQAALIGFAKVTRDITEQRNAKLALEETRAQLIQSQKLEALGQLTGGVAHDFNNILQVISSGITLAQRLPAGSDRLARILQEMRSAAARGADLTRQLLAFSRQAPLRPEFLETAKGIEDAVALISRVIRPGITLEVAVAPECWPLRVDVSQFEVALLNLAVNARDAMPEGGTLRIAAENRVLDGTPQGLSGRFVAIGVRDTGIGIPGEILERIFEPFFTTKPVGKGTGLGLSQVHGFAQQAGGAVTIASRVDEGTEFTLLLPAATEGPEAGEQDEPGEQGASAPLLPAGLRVLVVDDDAAVGRLTVGMLEGAGQSPKATTEADKALRWLSEGMAFDVVVSDVVMLGGMGGLDLARAIRQRWPALPVLLVTGYTRDAEIIQREFPVLHKPFTALELTLAIRGLLRRAAAPAR